MAPCGGGTEVAHRRLLGCWKGKSLQGIPVVRRGRSSALRLSPHLPRSPFSPQECLFCPPLSQGSSVAGFFGPASLLRDARQHFLGVFIEPMSLDLLLLTPCSPSEASWRRDYKKECDASGSNLCLFTFEINTHFVSSSSNYRLGALYRFGQIFVGDETFFMNAFFITVITSFSSLAFTEGGL